MVIVRALVASDIPQVVEVQRSAYPDGLLEPPETFERKLRLGGPGALGAFEDGRMLAYLFCHPWTLGEVAPLSSDIVLPEAPDCLYVHDLAVRPEARGRGLGDLLTVEALDIAESLSLRACALVAVQSSRPFWERHGFKAQRELEYGPGNPACYMVRK